jgi:hypothetical protein
MASAWGELVELEPSLGLLEHEITKVQDWPDRPYFCANAYWYGEHGFKREVERRVGWGRHGLRAVTDLHEGGTGLHFQSGTELIVRTETYDSLVSAIHAREEQDGRGVLWTSDAYSTAYQYLYAILPDCRHDGESCR